MLLVDTGADGILLNLHLAALLGFEEADLVTEHCAGAGGTIVVRRPKTLDATEIEIGGKWLPVPSLKFAQRAPFSLPGRDLMFSHFELRMTADKFELLPLKGKKQAIPRSPGGSAVSPVTRTRRRR